MGYKAEDLEVLAYDFSAVGGPVGTIPEPSQDQVEQLQAALRAMQADLIDDKGVVDMQKVRAKVAEAGGEGELARRTREQTTAALAEVCSQSPSHDELWNLPHRHFAGFSAYLVSALLNPR